MKRSVKNNLSSKNCRIEKIVEKLVPVVEVRNNVVVPLVKEVEKVVVERIEVPILQKNCEDF